MSNDWLQDMLTRQLYLQRDVYKSITDDMTTKERVEFITWNVLALQDELHEALQETSWKPWAKSEYLDEKAFTKELVDAWHFLMNLFLIIHPDPTKATGAIVQGYYDKAVINQERQLNDYDGVSTKCPNCKRALDDVASD